VGTLALGHYHDSDTVASIIIGTGTNACYLERVDAIIKCQGLLTSSGYMVLLLFLIFTFIYCFVLSITSGYMVLLLLFIFIFVYCFVLIITRPVY